ncbi:MAG: hypothetical protein KQA41_04505 [Candidatus Aenigmarchaeota archaeon]|nr:hypothetical protein [Candidatus Aenigmarchaeota archaeon]
MYLFGFYEVGVDHKNRIVIPSKLRKEITHILFLLNVDPKEPLFQLYYEIFPEIIHPYNYIILFLSKPEIFEANIQWVINQMKLIYLDKQGRIVLPEKYGDKVYVLGQEDRIEIWPINEYNRRTNDIKNRILFKC